MSSSGSTYGDIHRYEPPRESAAAALGIVLLTLVEIVLVGMFTYGLINGWGIAANDGGFGNMFLGTVLATMFVNLAFILLLYRKEFLPDVMIVKKRRRKWEDLYIREEDADGESLTDGATESFKRAIYPYYKR
ncbi:MULTISPECIES: hypothetical protein [unclassified Halorhabdus]|uniref:DUF7318 family protein n=1 Tax=unclassified Halorhabdus TaxID=2621901 RepID=UPI0023D9E66A|nr:MULTISPECIES: hypothetical protein [unclassified Halorhabdus]WEL17189.1 putative membrane protein [Halorhabdus sp. SVX81]WEL21071.1 putative membrane protein [Halorhabdus sp. BNX81]